jgi:hypothetical protein
MTFPTKSIELEAWIMTQAEHAGRPISRSKANRLKKRVMREGLSPDLARVIGYADHTGETAVNRVIRDN